MIHTQIIVNAVLQKFYKSVKLVHSFIHVWWFRAVCSSSAAGRRKGNSAALIRCIGPRLNAPTPGPAAGRRKGDSAALIRCIGPRLNAPIPGPAAG